MCINPKILDYVAYIPLTLYYLVLFGNLEGRREDLGSEKSKKNREIFYFFLKAYFL